jgi:hypothetical protein
VTTRLFASLEDRLAPTVPGCPRPTIEQYVREAAIETCEQTLAWRFEQDLIRLTAGVYEYDYETPENTEVVGVIHAALNGNKIDALTQEQIHSRFPSWPDQDRRSTPRFLGQFDPDHFVVAPVPDASITYDIKMFLALRPTQDADGMDKTVFDECELAITHGSLAKLLSLPEKSWTDKGLADYHARQFIYRCSARRAKANLGVGRASVTARMNPLA